MVNCREYIEYIEKFSLVQMKKIAALDYGDSWTGIALSDPSGILARPHSSVASKDLLPALTTLLEAGDIDTVVVGIPYRMKGGDSEQTTRTKALLAKLQVIFKEQFPGVTFIGWDERLSSKRAQSLGKSANNATGKDSEHARAAAFILDSYLTYRAFHSGLADE